MVKAERRAQVIWEGPLVQGKGTIVSTSSTALRNMPVTWASRTEQPDGKTSPEELIAAAHAECYVMGLALNLANASTPASSLTVDAVCTLIIDDKGPKITSVDLNIHGTVPGVDAATFVQIAKDTDASCPVSNALRNNVAINVIAHLDNK